MQKNFARKSADSQRNWLGPALAGVLIVALAGWGISYFLRQPVPQAPPDVGKEVAELFLQQIREGNADLAWQSTTADFKSDEGRESFARRVREYAALWPAVEFHKYRQGELNGLPRGQCVYQISEKTAIPLPIKQVRIAVAKEENTWKVEGLFLDPPEQAASIP